MTRIQVHGSNSAPTKNQTLFWRRVRQTFCLTPGGADTRRIFIRAGCAVTVASTSVSLRTSCPVIYASKLFNETTCVRSPLARSSKISQPSQSLALCARKLSAVTTKNQVAVPQAALPQPGDYTYTAAIDQSATSALNSNSIH